MPTLESFTCPHCGLKRKDVEYLTTEPPKANRGCVVICVVCHKPSVFKDEVNLIKISDETMSFIDAMSPRLYDSIMAAIEVAKYCLERKQINQN